VTRSGRVVDGLVPLQPRPQTSEGLRSPSWAVIDLSKQVRGPKRSSNACGRTFAHAGRASRCWASSRPPFAHEVNQPLAAIAAGGGSQLALAGSADARCRRGPGTHKEAWWADAPAGLSEIIARNSLHGDPCRVPEQPLLSLRRGDRRSDSVSFVMRLESRGVAVSHSPCIGVARRCLRTAHSYSR